MALPDLSRLPALGTPPLTTDTIAGVVASSQQNARWTLSQIGSVTSGSFTVINVKNYGAIGDGSADDTAAIQNALNAAYSNGSNSIANIPVYFPAGNYKITHPLYIINTAGAHVFGAGMLASKIVNTGGTNVSFTASIAAATPTADFASVMTVTAISAGAIYRGTLISGSGVQSPTIVSDQLTGTPGSTGTYTVTPQGALGSRSMTGTSNSVLVLDGVAYSTFEELYLEARTDGLAVEYNWGKTATSPWAAQILLFKHIFFQAGPTGFGCRVGANNAQCDTSTWIDCFFGGATTGVGLKIVNLNAIGHSVIGGNFSSHSIGVHVIGGSAMNMNGVNFQVSTSYDIQIDGGAHDAYSISAVSSESTNFLSCSSAAASIVLTGCAQRSLGDGDFAHTFAPLTIEGCISTQGAIISGGARGPPLRISNSVFNRTDAFNWVAATTATAEITQTYFGDPINSIADLWRKRITASGIRTLGNEGATLTDDSVLYSSANNSGAVSIPVTVNISTPAKATFTLATHSFRAGLPVAFKTSGALPTGLTANTTYYVASTNLSTNTFELTTVSGSASNVVTSGSQSGAHTMRIVRVYAVGDHILKNNVAAAGSPGWLCTTAGEALATAVFKAEASVAA